MASATIGALRVILSANTAEFQKAMRGVQATMQNVGRDMQRFGKDMSRRLTVPIGLAGAGVLKVAGDFEASMNRVRAALGATDSEFISLRNLAREMGETTQFSASEAADAIETLAKNGLSASQILDGALQSSLLLAAAGGTNLSNSADIATDVMASFGKEAADLGKVVDGISGTLLTSKFNVDDYRLALGQAGGVAGGLGVELEEFNAVLAATAPLFSGGSDAGTSFKTFLTRLVPASDKAAETMDRLGLQFTEANGQMKAIPEVAEELRQALSGLSEEARTSALQDIFGRDAMRTAIGLMQQGEQGVRDMMAAIGDVSAMTQAEARMQGFNGEMRKLRSAFEGLLIAIADSGLLEAMTNFIKKLTEGVKWLAETNPQVLKFGTVFAGVAAVLGPLVATLGLIAAGIGALSAPVIAVTGAVVGLTAAFVAFGAEIGKILPKLEDVQARVGQMTAGVTQHMTDESFLGSFKRANGVVALTTQAFAEMYDAVVGNSYVPDMVTGVESWMKRLANNMPRLAEDAAQGTSDALKDLEATSLQVGDTLANSLSRAVTGLQDGTTSIRGAINDISSSIRDLLTQRFFQSLFGGLTIPGFAAGTNYAPGGVAVVGEQGPELVNLPRGSQVIPNDQIGGGPTIKNINVLDPSIVGDFLTSNQGEEVLMNFLSARGITGNA